MSFLDKLKQKSGQAAEKVASLSTQMTQQVGQQVTQAATSLVKTVVPTVSEETQRKRYEICLACPEFLEITVQCKKCGCFMKLKTVMESAQCPLKKW